MARGSGCGTRFPGLRRTAAVTVSLVSVTLAAAWSSALPAAPLPQADPPRTGAAGIAADGPVRLAASSGPCLTASDESGRAQLRARLDSAQRAADDFKRQHPQMEAAVATDSTQLQELEQQLQSAEEARRKVEPADPDHPPASVDALRTELREEQEQLAQFLSADPGLGHPSITRLRVQIDATRESLLAAAAAAERLAYARLAEAERRAAVEVQRARLAEDRALADQGAVLQLQLAHAQETYQQALYRYCPPAA
jgi:hypothetical protein